MECVVILAITLTYMRNSECSSIVGLSQALVTKMNKETEEEMALELQEDLDDLLWVLMEELSLLQEPDGEGDLTSHQYSLYASPYLSGFSSLLPKGGNRGHEAKKPEAKELYVAKTNQVETTNKGTPNNWPEVYYGSLIVMQNQNPPVFGGRARYSARAQAYAYNSDRIPTQPTTTVAEAVGTPPSLLLAANVSHGTTENSPAITITTAAEAEAGGGREARQAPPNIIYRRGKQPRPCSGDGTSAVFTGGNAMTYISFLANVLSLILNINNNANNNNNNNNINSNNNIDSNNANLNINSNNANQVNIMPPGGKRRRRDIPSWAQMDTSSHAFCSPSYGMVEGVVEAAVEASWRALAGRAGSSGTVIASS
ncbi:uncharacterized protein [Panulirus ornatus]|uniref:uncharacterized protein n=1 Tax=Panulirus ornatus TaxID=150431 RepID=UPI003A8BAAED